MCLLFLPPVLPSALKGVWLDMSRVLFQNPSMTLTLKVGVWVLCMTHCPIILNICAKLFQNYKNYVYKRPC
jgi:hypothetical protein